MGATIRSTVKALRSWAGILGTSTWRVNLQQTCGQESRDSAKSSHSKWWASWGGGDLQDAAGFPVKGVAHP